MKKNILAIGIFILAIVVFLVIYFIFKNPAEEPFSVDPWENSITLDISENIQFLEEVKEHYDKGLNVFRVKDLSEEEVRESIEEIKSLNLSSNAESLLLTQYHRFDNFPSEKDFDILKFINGSRAISPGDYNYSSCYTLWELDTSHYAGGNYQTNQGYTLKRCGKDYIYSFSSKACPQPSCDFGSTYIINLSEESVSRIIS